MAFTTRAAKQSAIIRDLDRGSRIGRPTNKGDPVGQVLGCVWFQCRENGEGPDPPGKQRQYGRSDD
jgi:hypothetical protein